MSKELEALNKKIIEQTILEMEDSLGESEEVIVFIVQEATKNIMSIKGNEPYELDDYDLKNFAIEMVQLCKNFIKTMDFSNTIKQALTPPQLSEDVEEYIEIIQNSCAECKYSCWYKENYDLDACELNKNMTETNLNASIIGDDCPLPELIKQHIQTQASEIERLKEENKILNNAYNSVLRDNINVHQKIKNGDFRESCEDWNSKITITSDNDIIDTIGMKYVNCLDKLNEIREAVYSDKPMSYRLAMVKQILGDSK